MANRKILKVRNFPVIFSINKKVGVLRTSGLHIFEIAFTSSNGVSSLCRKCSLNARFR